MYIENKESFSLISNIPTCNFRLEISSDSTLGKINRNKIFSTDWKEIKTFDDIESNNTSNVKAYNFYISNYFSLRDLKNMVIDTVGMKNNNITNCKLKLHVSVCGLDESITEEYSDYFSIISKSSYTHKKNILEGRIEDNKKSTKISYNKIAPIEYVDSDVSSPEDAIFRYKEPDLNQENIKSKKRKRITDIEKIITDKYGNSEEIFFFLKD